MQPPLLRTVSSLLIMLLITLLAGEATVRVFHYFKPLFLFYDDSYNRFRGRPFAPDFDFILNSQGFKDTEFPRRKKKNFRILGLGDSFAYGAVPYKNNYLTLLEAQLQDEGLAVEVLNMGIPSTGPQDYLALLRQEGLKLQPDLVLLSLFIGNDITENIRKKKWHEYSYLASLFHFFWKIKPKYEGQIVHGTGTYCDDCPSLAPAAYLQLEKERSAVYLTDNVDVLPLFDKALDSLGQIQEICQEKGIALTVVVIPDEVQINAQLQQQVRAQLPGQGRSWHTLLPNERLALGLQKMHINFLDLYPAFAQASQTKQLYRLRDTHWNIAGNQLAAQLIQQHLRPYLH
ncbi:alginate O-acetyltransferase AlgX-related protein [Candidatus Electronema sp. PJ]|uniref:alginate O-acetyltransferase AlgX-related protein n=1 Tax=Candidatus Electronema sp. PJ TaxID=3401572 RepID=UPI003AA8AE21